MPNLCLCFTHFPFGKKQDQVHLECLLLSVFYFFFSPCLILSHKQSSFLSSSSTSTYLASRLPISSNPSYKLAIKVQNFDRYAQDEDQYLRRFFSWKPNTENLVVIYAYKVLQPDAIFVMEYCNFGVSFVLLLLFSITYYYILVIRPLGSINSNITGGLLQTPDIPNTFTLFLNFTFQSLFHSVWPI